MIALAAAKVSGPHIDWAALSPVIALTGAACIVLLVGLLRARVRAHARGAGPDAGRLAVTSACASGSGATNRSSSPARWRWTTSALTLTVLFCAGGHRDRAAVLARRGAPAEAGEGEYYALLLSSVLGMVVLVAAQNFVVLFLGFELLSIPLYVLCATHMRREHSLESGLKYLIIGSVGSATLLYGLALLYGATGSTDFAGDRGRRGGRQRRPAVLAALALIVAGLAFKASVAPFHQWTPDVYEGAPTPDHRVHGGGHEGGRVRRAAAAVRRRADRRSRTWAPALAVLAAFTIVVGNVGAIGQSSLKRLLAYSSVAQAGYMLAGVVVSTRLGIQATVFYLGAYLLMNMAAFAVICARERETGLGDDISSLYGLGADRPMLAWPMTIAMLSLAGLPGHGGLLRQALPDRGGGRQRVRVARRRDRARLGDLARRTTCA